MNIAPSTNESLQREALLRDHARVEAALGHLPASSWLRPTMVNAQRELQRTFQSGGQTVKTADQNE